MKSRDRGIDGLVPELGTLRRDPQPFVCAGSVGTRGSNRRFLPVQFGRRTPVNPLLMSNRGSPLSNRGGRPVTLEKPLAEGSVSSLLKEPTRRTIAVMADDKDKPQPSWWNPTSWFP